MTDVGEETIVMNGYIDRCLLMTRDARRMFAKDSDGLKNGLKVRLQPRPLDVCTLKIYIGTVRS